VEALQFYGDLNTRYKVIPPEAMTWAFDDIVAGGQSDRYAMTQLFAPYGTLINDPKISRTGGKWAWTTVQGPHSKEEGRTWVDGHFLGVPKFTRNKEWALEFIAMCCSREWQKRAMIRGNAPPLRSVLEDPEMVERIGWPPVAAQAIETGFPTPGHPVWDTLEVQLRSAISQTLHGQATAKVALDETATEWQRSLRRAGIGRG
jgi:ABC-type glycerol-3-phosphate transport system substrate-binding protein